MAKTQEENHAVVAPLPGSGVLSTVAYGSTKLDKLLTTAGIKSNYTFFNR